MPAKTPDTLPVTGRVFQITLPDSEQWFALFAGALQVLTRDWYYEADQGGLTPQQTAQEFEKALAGVRYDTGQG